MANGPSPCGYMVGTTWQYRPLPPQMPISCQSAAHDGFLYYYDSLSTAHLCQILFYACAWDDCWGALWICCWEPTVTEARGSQSWRGRIFNIDGGSGGERSIGRAQTFYTMNERMCPFGDTSLVRIHEHGATARLCCACGDGEATVTGVKASHLWRERIFHIDGGAENGRSICRVQTFYTVV